jgi:hypothetical protein
MKEKRKRNEDVNEQVDEIDDGKEREITEKILKEYRSLSPNIVHDYICDRFVFLFFCHLISPQASRA